MRKITQSTVDLVKKFEGYRSKAYKVKASEKYYTIGYGHYGKDVKPDATTTKEEAEKILKKDMQKFADLVNKWDKEYKWSKSEFDALVSFCYNIGNIDQLTANGLRSRNDIAESMLLYCHCGCWVLSGLKKRREKERAIFIRDTKRMKVNAVSGLNIRAEPSEKGKKIGALRYGVVVTVLNTDKNNWSQIDVTYKNKHRICYCKGDFLK